MKDGSNLTLLHDNFDDIEEDFPKSSYHLCKCSNLVIAP